jgi:DeoR/GlpR family transcriptional regulator of sugar metabolism
MNNNGNEEGLFREERLQLIMKLLLENKKVLVADLVTHFNVSASTIRLDLAELETRGVLSRTHGGAILPEKLINELITSKNLLALRDETKTAEKDAIAKSVVDLINDGDSIMIDGGSTTARIAYRLAKKRNLTVITTSYHLLSILIEIPDVKIFTTGGLLHRDFKDFTGEISLDSISRFHTDITILGIDGISVKHGLTTPDIMMAQIKKRMIASSKNLVVVADHSKIGKVCLVPVIPLDSSLTLVTDDKSDPETIALIRSLGTKTIVAPIE